MPFIVPPRDPKQATILFNKLNADKLAAQERATELEYNLKERQTAVEEKDQEIENLLSVIEETQAKVQELQGQLDGYKLPPLPFGPGGVLVGDDFQGEETVVDGSLYNKDLKQANKKAKVADKE